MKLQSIFQKPGKYSFLALSVFSLGIWGAPQLLKAQPAADEAAEVKLRVDLKKISEVTFLSIFGLEDSNGKTRSMITIDTPEDTLRKQGVQLRIRQEFKKAEIEATVKIRNVERSQLESIIAEKAIDCETLLTETRETSVCSSSASTPLASPSRDALFPIPFRAQEIQQGWQGAAHEFYLTDEQRSYLKEVKNIDLNTPSLQKRLQIRSLTKIHRWKLDPGSLDLPSISNSLLIVEKWRPSNPSTPPSIELSWRVPFNRRTEAQEALFDLLNRLEIPTQAEAISTSEP